MNEPEVKRIIVACDAQCDIDAAVNAVEDVLLESERGMVRDLLQLAADRAQAEAETEDQYQSFSEKAQFKLDAADQTIIIRFATQKEAQESEYREACQKIDSRLESGNQPPSGS